MGAKKDSAAERVFVVSGRGLRTEVRTPTHTLKEGEAGEGGKRYRRSGENLKRTTRTEAVL